LRRPGFQELGRQNVSPDGGREGAAAGRLRPFWWIVALSAR
jgi:hypothetical protein